MKRVLLLSLAAVLVFVGFLLAKMPASFVFNHAANATNAFYMENVQGGLLQGSANNFQVRLPAGMLTKRASVLHLGRIEWDIQVLPLILGNVAAKIKTHHHEQSLDVDFNAALLGQSLSLNPSLMSLDLGVWMNRLRLPLPIKAEGILEADIQSLELVMQDELPFASDVMAQIVLKDLAVTMQQAVELGTFGINVSSDAQDASLLQASFSDVDAVLGFSGSAQFSQSEKNYSVEASAIPNAKTPDAVTQALSFMGRKQADGSLPIRYQGKL